MRKHLLTLLSLLSLGTNAQSESGLWMGADASYDISRRWSAELGIGSRFEQEPIRPTRYDASLGLDYKPLKWLKLGAGYSFIRDYNAEEGLTLSYKNDATSPDGIRHDSNGYPVVNGYNGQSSFWRMKNRLFFDVTEKWKLGRFGFSLRERYQFTHLNRVEGVESKYRNELEESDLPACTTPYVGPYVDPYGDSYWYGFTRYEDKAARDKHLLRTRLLVDYNIKGVPATPYVSYEMFNDLSDTFSILRHRVQAGIDVTLTPNKQHALALGYLYQHGNEEGTACPDLHAITFGYKFKFESARAKAQKKAAKKKNKQK